MKKGYSTGAYWLLSLACAFAVLSLVTHVFMDHDTLAALFRYNRHYENVRDMAASVLVLGLRPCTTIAGMLAAMAYNYRCGRVLLSMNDQRFGNENLLACMLCAAVGGTAAAYYVLMISTLGFAMLIIGLSFAWTITPLLAVFFGLDRFSAHVAQALRGAAVHYPRQSRVRVHTLQGAFRGIFDWNSSRPLRLVVTIIFFTSLSMLMNGLLEGPFNGLVQTAVNRATDKPIREAFIGLVAIVAPHLPMVSGLLCAVFFEKAIVEPLQRYLHPASLLLTAGPLMAVLSFLALCLLTLAGLYSVMLLLFIGGVIFAACASSKQAAIAVIIRMIARRNIRYEESLTLKVILLTGIMLPLLFMFTGG